MRERHASQKGQQGRKQDSLSALELDRQGDRQQAPIGGGDRAAEPPPQTPRRVLPECMQGLDVGKHCREYFRIGGRETKKTT